MNKMVILIGAGGISYHLKSGLGVWLEPDDELVVIDGDIVEENNASRQYPGKHGEWKVEAFLDGLERVIDPVERGAREKAIIGYLGYKPGERMCVSITEVLQEIWEKIVAVGSVYVVCCPDNHEARVQAIQMQELLVKEGINAGVFLAGNSTEQGYCWCQWGEDEIGKIEKTHPDIFFPAAEEKEEEGCSRRVLQTFLSNMRTAVCVMRVLNSTPGTTEEGTFRDRWWYGNNRIVEEIS